MIETIHLQLLLATLAGGVGRRQARVVAYLIEEKRVLKEQHRRVVASVPFSDTTGPMPVLLFSQALYVTHFTCGFVLLSFLKTPISCSQSAPILVK